MFKHELGDGADLRILELHHAPAFLEYVAENRDYLGAWLGWAYNITTVEDAARFIQRGLSRFADDGLPWVGIWLNNRMAGGILFFPLEKRIRSTEIGYWLGEQAAGQGLMTRSVRAMLRYVFEDLKLNRVGLISAVDNTRSIGVAQRAGFSYEGIRRHGWMDGDELIDVAVYSMLASDWQQQQS